MLGAGGMGEVYRARDSRLDRDVAVKVLATHITASEDGKQRFEREARALSALQHPHICSLYDVGHQDGIDFLVMEYLQGEPLNKRIERGPIPLNEALEIGISLADALDQAHQHGLIHRDLKPANVMLTPVGAKLLDFGLVKPQAQEVSITGETKLLTQAQNLTTEGMIVGTAAYMAPEQLEGKPADARTDIFAFGTVMFEMLTGQRAFGGDTQASLIASIMTAEAAAMSKLQPMVSPALERTINKCLAKSPEQRWQTVRDLRSELQWIIAQGNQTATLPVAVQRPSRWARIGLAAGALLVLLPAAAVALHYWREQPKIASEIRFDFPLPPKATLRPVDIPMVSPDGERIVFCAAVGDQPSRLWIRPLNSATVQQLPDTEGAALPFWSPDSQSVGFLADGKLRKVGMNGGRAQTICEIGQNSNFGAASWGRGDLIIFGKDGALFRVSAKGGTPAVVRERHGFIGQYWPQLLPDGKHFLYDQPEITKLRTRVKSL